MTQDRGGHFQIFEEKKSKNVCEKKHFFAKKNIFFLKFDKKVFLNFEEKIVFRKKNVFFEKRKKNRFVFSLEMINLPFVSFPDFSSSYDLYVIFIIIINLGPLWSLVVTSSPLWCFKT